MEKMGCSNTKTIAVKDAVKSPESKEVFSEVTQLGIEDFPTSEAFTIPYENDNASFQNRKKPPKRIQALQNFGKETTITLATIQDKQQRAELRRQEILQQKILTCHKNMNTPVQVSTIPATTSIDNE